MNLYERAQFLTDEVKRLREVNRQQAAGWKSCNDKRKQLEVDLKDANIYIQLLEDELGLLRKEVPGEEA